MSGFLPAFVAIRERQRRARLFALLLGLSYAGTAAAQVPTFAPAAPPAAVAADPPPNDRGVGDPAPPAVAAPPTVTPPLVAAPAVPDEPSAPADVGPEGDARPAGDT